MESGGSDIKSHGRRLTNAFLRAFAVTLFALFLSILLSIPLSASLSAAFSSPEKSDFRITDLYAQFAESRPVRYLDDRIVLVEIGHSGREEIAEGLEIISLCGPKAVGMDVNFLQPGDNDSALISAIRNIPGIVLPIVLDQKESGDFEIIAKPFFYGQEPGINYGAVNLPAENENSSIREYAIGYRTDKDSIIPSFVMALAQAGNEKNAGYALKRGNQLEKIDYPSREFKTINIDEIADNPEILTDKYVLIGTLQEVSDMHSTPINSYMAGLEIHAYSLSTLLDGKWFGEMPAWIDYTVAFILCFIVVFLAVYMTSKLRGLTLRFVQLLFLFITVWIGYALYLDNGIICNFSHTLLMLAFGLLALDILTGLEGIVKYSLKPIKKIRKKCNENCSF